MNKILVTTSSFGKNNPDALKRLEQMGFEIELNPYKRKLTEPEVTSLVQKYNPIGIIAGVEPLTKNVISVAGNLKVISRCGIGMDSVDLEAAELNDIAVTNTPDAPTIPVAELTIGSIFCMLRRIHLSDASIREGKWYRPVGNLLHGKTVGIIGCGRIGSALGEMLGAFDCRILGCDPTPPMVELFYMVNLDELLSQSDIVSLHLPYSKEHHHFIDQKELHQMKKGSFMVNISRGGLVNETALYDALHTGHLAGASIDSFENEPYSGELAKLDNVVLTGHIGSYAVEGRVEMERQAVDNLINELDNLDLAQ